MCWSARLPAHPRSAVPWAVWAAALLAAACTPQPRSDGPWNVVLVLVDTLRTDRMSLYGYHRETTPTLDRFAREAVVFDRAAAQSGCTFPSVNSIFTSRYPSRFLGQPERRMGIPEGIPTLPEILAHEGYATAAVSSSVVVRNTPSTANLHGGFGRGFQSFHEECVEQDAACVNAQALQLLDTLQEPFFLYLHYLEPHNPYSPPPQHPRRFEAPPTAQDFVRVGNHRPLMLSLYRGGEPVELSADDLEHLRTLYDEEVRYFDEQLAVLLQRLRRDGLLGRTLFVLTSDHGEELMDHGHISHCRDLAYETILSAPLLMRIPGGPSGRRQARAQVLDLTPTVLDLLGLGYQHMGLEGTSLRPVIEEDRQVNRHLLGWQGRMRTVSDGRFKLLYDLEADRGELFDLEGDPGETVDLADAQPERAAALRHALLRWIQEVEGAGSRRRSLEEADELRKQLEAVGYL
jgi:arylsulfatase